MPHEEWPDIERMLKDQGWTISTTGGGHIKALPADKTQKPVFLSATPSDWRAMRNNLRDLKKSGFRYPPDAPDEPEDKEDDATTEEEGTVFGDWGDLFPAGLIYGRPIDNVEAAIAVLVGKQICRTDRVDPRDPKTIVAIDVDGKRVVYRDRHQRKVSQDIREFSRDLRKNQIRFLEPDEEATAQQLPDVGGMRFSDALLALRTASELTCEDLAEIIDDACSGEVVEMWERQTSAPTRRAYQALCTLWPGIRQAYPPKEELPDTLPVSAMTNTNNTTPTVTDAIAALDEAVQALEICSRPDIHIRQRGGRWYLWVQEEAGGRPAIAGEGNSLDKAIADIFLKLQAKVDEHEAQLRKREQQLAKQRTALSRFGGQP